MNNFKIYIYPYKKGSKSVASLKKAINAKTIKLVGSKYKPKSNHVVVNWGSSSFVNTTNTFYPGIVLNYPLNVRMVANKLGFFQQNPCQEHLVSWTTNKQDVLKWVDEGNTVLARTKLTGHSGEGIIKITTPEEIVDAPLYTLYKRKVDEYRVHVFNGQVIDVVKKLVPKDLAGNIDYQIRTHANGWIFAREGVDLKLDAVDMAIKQVQGMGLFFGAVDMIYNAHEDRFYVLEINTAPGLEGTTVSRYADAIINFTKGIK